MSSLIFRLFSTTFLLSFFCISSHAQNTNCDGLSTRVARLACLKENSYQQKAEMEKEARKKEARLRQLQQHPSNQRASLSQKEPRKSRVTRDKPIANKEDAKQETLGARLRAKKDERHELRAQRRILLNEKREFEQAQEDEARELLRKKAAVQLQNQDSSQPAKSSASAHTKSRSAGSTRLHGLVASSDEGIAADDDLLTYF